MRLRLLMSSSANIGTPSRSTVASSVPTALKQAVRVSITEFSGLYANCAEQASRPGNVSEIQVDVTTHSAACISVELKFDKAQRQTRFVHHPNVHMACPCMTQVSASRVNDPSNVTTDVGSDWLKHSRVPKSIASKG